MSPPLLLLLLLLLLPAGCSGVSVKRSKPGSRRTEERRSALDSGTLSRSTQRFLFRHGLKSTADLRHHLEATGERVAAFHLAEMAYRDADQNNDKALFVAAAHYAYAYLLDRDLGPPPNRFDPMFRLAVDIYNLALARFGSEVREKKPTGVRALGREYLFQGFAGPATYRPVQEYEAKGLDRHSGAYGLGMALIAEQTDEAGFTLAYPRTLVVGFEEIGGPGGRVAVTATLHDPTSTGSVEIEGGTVPLEADFSTPLAYLFDRTPDVSGRAALLHPGAYLDKSRVYFTAPYDRRKIPVVFVHGLMATPQRWSVLINDLMADPVLRRRFQLWLFAYPSGLPIAYSAMLLRKELKRLQKKHGFRDLVLVGHSMGGLVARLNVTSSGDRLTRLLSRRPIDEWELTKPHRDLLRSALVFQALPFVSRVVFLSTPHRGAHLAGSPLGALGAALVDLPDEITEAHEAAASALRKDPARTGLELSGAMLTGIANLEPKSPLLKEIAHWKFPRGLKAHSVIGRSDSLVAYESAHLKGAESETLVESGHGSMHNQGSIVEVMRILRLHEKETEK